MLVRVRSKDGTFRFELDPNADATELAEKILSTAANPDPSSLALSNQPRGGETNIADLVGRTLNDLGLRHGDLVFVSYKCLPETNGVANGVPNGTSHVNVSTDASSTPAGPSGVKRPWETVQEDPVDVYWRQRDGKIPRQRDTNFCKHGENAMCDYCMPLEPFDVSYHQSHAIKHLSYHAYLRKFASSISASASASTASLPPLENLSYHVKVPCTSGSHPSWPAGICSKCQPSAITLQPQPFRMVDHVEFSSPGLIDSFLSAWRRTGAQRFGFLVGHYEPYPDVPMGIKAVVEAIHEPPQEGDLDGLSVGWPWEDEARITRLAHACKDLQLVGVIWTDLTPQAEDKTKTVCKRHADSYFLSAQETLFVAKLQSMHPTPSRSAPSGVFSSRFVTCVMSGTPEGGVDIVSYQASEQASAMVDADMIEPSMDPGTVRVKEEQGERYVPDVFFRFKNEYGIEVKQSAKPCFPVEYLLVNVTNAVPKTPTPFFHVDPKNSFPIENRPGLDDQKFQRVLSDLSRLKVQALSTKEAVRADAAGRIALLNYLSDWHLLAFLDTMNVFSEADMQVLARTATDPSNDSNASLDNLLATDGWKTLLAIVKESAPAPRIAPPAPAPSNPDDIIEIPDDDVAMDDIDVPMGGATKFCPHCTFENPADASDCAICGLPMN